MSAPDIIVEKSPERGRVTPLKRVSSDDETPRRSSSSQKPLSMKSGTLRFSHGFEDGLDEADAEGTMLLGTV